MAMSKQASVNQLDRLPRELWSRIFSLVPHVSRLRCRCVCSKWERFLKAEQQSGERRPLSCLAVGVPVEFHEQGDEEWEKPEEVEGDLFCFAFGPSGHVVPLPVPFPPGWRPEPNAGGFRAGGGLVAFLCEGHYRVGNPVHNQWEKVAEEVWGLSFLRNSFELVVDEHGGSYQIVAFGMNDGPRHPNDVRQHHNWVMQVYSSRERTWKRGASLDQLVFRNLCDVRVFERTVYFLGWIVAQAPNHAWLWRLGPQDPVVLEQDSRISNRYYSLSVWGYDLDTDSLTELVPAAQYFGDRRRDFPPGYETNHASMRLHVTRQPGQAASHPSPVVISIVVAARGPRDEIIGRLLLDEQDGPSTRCWSTESVVRLNELTSGGPGAALVADGWGLTLFAYMGFDFINETHEFPFPRPTMTILCYQRDNRKWVEWCDYAPKSKCDWDAPAVAFVPCECCG